jgi:hypothetical protein
MLIKYFNEDRFQMLVVYEDKYDDYNNYIEAHI